MELEIGAFVKFLAILSVTMATIVFIIGLVMKGGRDVVDTFISGFIVVVLANYPLGLPGTLTSQLTIIARQMAQKNVFLKRLEIIETFGAATVVASDKTGTLTKNDMAVCDLWYDSRYTAGLPDFRQNTLVKRRGEGKAKEGRASFYFTSNNFLDLLDEPLPIFLRSMALCNKAKTENVENFYEIEFSRPQSDLSPTAAPSAQFSSNATGSAKKSESPVKFSFNSQAMRTVEKHYGARAQSRIRISGSPSEVALLRYVEKISSVQKIRQDYEIVFEIPFNSIRKWHLVIVRKNGADLNLEKNLEKNAEKNVTYILMMKGAPEVLIRKCGFFASEEGIKPITEEFNFDFQDAYLHFGREGKEFLEGRRVIGFCFTEFSAPFNFEFDTEKENYPNKDLNFLGMAAIMDPPREDTAPAIAACKQAGIKVFMVTGDHPVTAAAIAREIGLIGTVDRMESGPGFRQNSITVVERKESHDESAVVHGEKIDRLTDSQWDELLRQKYLVFARTTPEQKLKIVEQCQKRKEVVAVTGDGVNDAPALKRADIGVAMGKNGSQVAKEAADIILMDDRFSSIVLGIEQGRLLFENLKKTIAYTLPHLLPEIVVVLLNLMLGFPLPLTPLQIISVDLGTEMAPTISMAYEPSEKDLMKKPPRKPGHRLVTKSLLIYAYVTAGSLMAIGCCIAYFWVFWEYGINIKDLPFTATKFWLPVTSQTNLTDPDAIFCSNGRCFDPILQEEIQRKSTAAWHITMVMNQVYHLWMCKTRRISIFQHGMQNLMSIFAVIIEICLIVIFTYVPGIQTVMGAAAPLGISWVPSIGVGILLWIYNEGRKWYIRRNSKTRLAKILYW